MTTASAPPLAGLLVADLSRVLAGPTAAVMLADLGARVVKVERPGTGDDTRAFGPPWAGSSSAYFESANRSKESIALDFRDAADLALAHELVARADVVVENYQVGALTKYGLDYAAARALNPGVIYASISGFGTGAGAGLPGYDLLVQAVGGLMSITGERDGDPMKAGVALVDLLTAKDTTMGILAAVLHRERTGEGQHVEVNLLTSLLGSLVNQASTYLATGVAPRRLGNVHPSIAPYEALRCRDGHLTVAVGNDRQWAAFAETIGDAELAGDARMATNAGRVAHHAELVERIEARLAQEEVAVWADRLRRAGVPAGKVNDVGEAIALAAGLGLRPTIDVGAGHPAQVRHPVDYSAFAVRPPEAPPALDEHGEALRAWLTTPAREA